MCVLLGVEYSFVYFWDEERARGQLYCNVFVWELGICVIFIEVQLSNSLYPLVVTDFFVFSFIYVADKGTIIIRRTKVKQ